MESSILKQIARFLQEQKKQKRWLVVFLCLAIIVGFGTVTALKMRGQAMTHKEKRVICQLAVHQHADECYDENKENLICGYADYVVHVHNEDCYDWNGNLTCQLPEVEKHEHSEECYTEEATLICGLEETAGHQHGAECYTTQQGGLICQVPEHTHAAECYDETGAVICGLEEHIHEDACYEWTDVLICQLAEGADGHTHTEACYEVKEILSCGKLELHTHTDECYEKINEEEELSETNRRLVCTVPVLEEHIHTEDAGCLETVEVTANGELVEEGTVEEETAEKETAEGETEEEIFTTDLDGEETEEEDGESKEETEIVDDAGEEDTESSETDGEADGDEAEGADEENATYEIVKIFVGDGYKVTASYNEDANIPEEAELIAEQITVDTDEEHYTKREAQYRKTTGEKDAVMKALFKIGFYIEGKEIEPETPVNLTIQFLDEKGLPEGAPITVVHFADKGTEVLDGSEAEGGSTSFDMNSFSEVAIGYKRADAEGASVKVSESFEYDDEAFKLVFHVDGKAKFVEADDEEKNNDKNEIEKGGNGEENKLENLTDEESETVSDKKSNDEEENQKFDLKVNILDEESERYKEYAEYTDGLNNKSELFLVRPLSYSLTYNNKELDLSGCNVEVEVTPKVILNTYAKASVSNDSESEDQILEGEDNPVQIDVVVVGVSEKGVNELGSASFWDEDILDVEDEETSEEDSPEQDEVDEELEENAEQEDNTIVITPDTNDFAVTASGTAYPKFMVQYYANLDCLVTTDDWCTPENPKTEKYPNGVYTGNVFPWKTSNLRALSLIDTSKKSGIGQLPRHGVNYAEWQSGNNKGLKNLQLSSNDGGSVKTELKLTEVYSSKEFEFNKAPNINYFDALDKNVNYKLKEIWILKEDGDPQSIDQSNWDIKAYTENIGFTNRQETAEKDSNYIYIEDGAVIRLVYDAGTDNEEFGATFYDYDISNGTSTSNGVSVMNTKTAGINSKLNPNISTNQYAFGNENCGTAFGKNTWSGNNLNATNAKNGYLGCTFGLAKGVNAKNEIVFADGISAPNIFGSKMSEPEEGKTPYDAELTFKRKGDTYTLTSAKGQYVNVSNLDSFNHPECGGSKHNHILTNNFWPLDTVPENKRKDMMFGKKGEQENQKFGTGEWDKLPVADDGKDHNCFFGMFYEVEFELSEEYVGPLEYLFYGDDDMWVFLDNETLVCDIGGVHSSVGEYVDLWDYLGERDADGNIIKKKAGKHTLKFFYTERGASGSSCWMQFTLPSVTSRDTDPASGRLSNSLTVSKTVDSSNYAHIDLNKEYTFEINFKKTDDLPLLNNYGYKKYRKVRVFDEAGMPKIDKDGKPVYEKEKNDKGEEVDKTVVIEENGLIADGETFKLRDSEYIVIDYLPENTTYTIKEVREANNPNYSINTTVDGKEQEANSGTVQDQIDSKVESDVEYVNDYTYQLPETGGSGSSVYTIAGVLAILSGAGFMYRKKVRERRV